jgi:predicted AAA+ superfamily ATPase
MVGHPKFYFFDAGVYRALRPSGPLDSPEEIDGASLETLCFQEIRAINDYFNYQYDLYYWRTSNGAEVDFVLYGPKGIIAFEVKRSKRITKKDLSGLKAFKSDFPEATLYLLYGGTKNLYEDGIKILPVDYALKQIPGILENIRQ